ncbi:MAG: PspC domain-containing protein [Bacteroidaceae bacterium]|nr:PspC domain-containing protein [Bacteroidaceae bacterium]
MGKLVRSANGKIGGVCAGIAEYFDWDVRTLRLVWFVAAIVAVGSPVLFYLILWLVMPEGNKKNYSDRMYERLGKKQ